MTDLATVRSRFVILTALRWLPIGLIAPSLVLLLSARGMSLASIGLLTAVYSAATLLLELPTGGLSDVIGRRPVMIAAAVVGAVSALLLAFATTPGWLAAAFLLMGLSRALDSGPLQAWYVDSVHAIDPDADLTRGLSRAGVAESVALAAGALGAGALAATVPLPSSGAIVIALSVPFIFKAALAVLQVAVVARWVTDTTAPTAADAVAAPLAAAVTLGSPWARLRLRTVETARDVPRAIGRGLRLAAHRRALQRLLLLTAALGAALSGIELLAPAHAADLLGGATAAAGPYAVLVTAGFLGSASGSALAPLAMRAARGAARAAMLATLAGAVALAAIAVPQPWGAGAAFVGFYLFLGIAGPLTEELMHREVSSAERATMLSLNSMALQATAIVVTAGLGAFAGATSIAAAFAAIAVALALGALTLARWPGVRRPATASAAQRQPSAQ
ncbi:MFS transporter [Demequina sp. NBRC 110051]|uniref:MFS transporter n=1 Tax=Demequina sp. NBRC 110051 TaxID=1570340 RepID=UPI0013566D76|nr:MFS transporter [Demequina sp. NBRC 110051]